jgi:hypothetical protein
MRLLLNREYGEKQTTGCAFLIEGTQVLFQFVTLELPWLDNKHNISCISPGRYDVIKIMSPTKGKCFMLLIVPGRNGILIHKGNSTKDTQGCILVGSKFTDINKDGITDIIDSTITLNKLLELCPNKLEIVIV